MKQDAFLRSINIQLDADHPERFKHFRPTSKSVRLLSTLLDAKRGNAVFVVAPYGSGKSITTGYLGQLVDNPIDANDILRCIDKRLTKVSPSLGRKARYRRASRRQGLFVPLYGHVHSAPEALKKGILDAMRRAALGRQARTIDAMKAKDAGDALALVDVCAGKLRASGRDRLVIVWDEFGRHLQGLVADGRPEELDVLQVLAEAASRSSTVPVSLVLLLHRSLLGYATGLPPGLRREWAKIEGRFQTIQYLDDSTELYELIGSLVAEERSSEPANIDFAQSAARSKHVGLFPEVTEKRLVAILASAHPLAPATLYLLPRIAARVAQNERTLFSFLQSAKLDRPVSPSALYGYFRGDFRTDAGAGGTQRPWLETESAVRKVAPGSVEEEALMSAFLLSLGLGGERSRATYAQLAFALETSTVTDAAGASSTIDGLVGRNLLVHRRHSDQVVIWHGTDVDLLGRLEDEKRRSATDFNLGAFLSREMPAPVWRPVEYNARRGVRRYLEAAYTTVAGLEAFWDEIQLKDWPPGTDGRVLHVLPESEDEVARAKQLAGIIDDPRLFVAVAQETSALRRAAVDLWCLLRMHADREMIGSDPMVKAELDHLTDDARTGLQPLVDRVLRPQPQGSQWFHMGSPVEAATVVQLRRVLSRTMEELFPHTPEIDSEMVVRRSPSPIIVNARKKVELGLLERYGQEALGIEGRFADMAIFRSVFLRTGLYRQKGEDWVLAKPEELAGPGLAAVWGRVRDFFVVPGDEKSFRQLLDQLKEPPYGVREGLLPLLLAAGIKAFSGAATVRRRDDFVEDLLPSVVEDIAKNPERYALDVVTLNEAHAEHLKALLALFAADDAQAEAEDDLFRACMGAALAWRQTLPEGVAASRYVTPEARAFVRDLAEADPVALFHDRLPRLLGETAEEPNRLVVRVGQLKEELDGVAGVFKDEAAQALAQILEIRGVPNGSGVRDQAAEWASCFSKSFMSHLPDQVTKGVLGRLQAPYRDDDALLNALSTLLVGRTLQQWDDSVVPAFRRELRSTFDAIETTAVIACRADELDAEAKKGLINLAETRTRSVVDHLAEVVGREQAAARLEVIATGLRESPVPAEGGETSW